jgi:hypothetical protein
MTVRTSAGSTIAISATLPATFDEAGFSAAGVVFKEIGEVTNIGEHGREYAKVTFQPLRTRATQKRKGSYDPGTIALQFGSMATTRPRARSRRRRSRTTTMPSG